VVFFIIVLISLTAEPEASNALIRKLHRRQTDGSGEW